jgi:hypothetical protein
MLEDLANTLIRSEALSGPSLDVFLAGVTMWPNPLLPEKPGDIPVRLLVAAPDGADITEAGGWPDRPDDE